MSYLTSLTVGVPKETAPDERRVALVPASVVTLSKKGFTVFVESGAGAAAGFSDADYTERGAKIMTDRAQLFAEASVILRVRAAGANLESSSSDAANLREGQILIAACDPLSAPKALEEIAARKATCFALELVPRITRAQSMDILSSMATIAGYKAVLMAANSLPRMFPMLMTAAGTVTPARVFIMGAGVAGLQAIATAKRLGAVVHAYDVRPAVKEQVESLGGRFVELDIDAGQSEDKGGYAKEMDEEFYRKQREKMTEVLSESDVVITTAAIPGRAAPILVTAEMVNVMPAGSMIIDLAAERGGNCELTKAGETIVENNVTIIGPVNLPGTIPYHASEMFSRNIVTFLLSMVNENQLQIDLEDEVLKSTRVTADGEIVHPHLRILLDLEPLEEETKPEEPASEKVVTATETKS